MIPSPLLAVLLLGLGLSDSCFLRSLIVDSLDATPKEKDGGIELSPKLKQFNSGQSSGEVNFFGHKKKSSLIKVNHESIPEDENQDDIVEVNGNPYNEYQL